jgi:hypothetical protein
MKVSDLIKMLEVVKNHVGDLDVMVNGEHGSTNPVDLVTDDVNAFARKFVNSEEDENDPFDDDKVLFLGSL